MGRVPLARFRSRAWGDGHSGRRRCPQPARPGHVAALGLHLRRYRSLMARIVVTGGAGFVGSHLCDALIARGDRVVVLDNLVTGRRENLGHLDDEHGFEFIDCDVSVHTPVTGPVDAVMHFASPASPPEYLSLPFETLDVGS